MKKYIFLIIALLSTIGAWADDVQYNNVNYRIIEGTDVSVYQDAQNETTLTGTVNIPASFEVESKTYSVKKVGYWRYGNKVDLVLPNTVTEISWNYVYAVNSLTLPTTFTSLNLGDLRNEIGTLNIPAETTTINPPTSSYGACVVGAYSVADGNSNYCSVDGVLFNKAKTTLIHFPALKANTYYTFPTTGLDGFTTIGANAFRNNNRIVKVTLPNTVTTINADAFRECDALYECVLSSILTDIGSNAFYSCDVLNICILPAGLKTIGTYAFYYCKLAPENNTLTLPGGLTSVGASAFYSGFKNNSVTVEFPATLGGGTGGSNMHVGSYAFNGCNVIRSFITQPVALGDNSALSGVGVAYVPAGDALYEQYKATQGWAQLYSATASSNRLKQTTTSNEDASIDLTLTEVLGANSSFAIKLNSTTEGATIKYVNSKDAAALAKDPTDWYDYDMTNKPDITMEDGATLKAIAFNADKSKRSPIKQKTYDKSSTTCNDPVIEAADGATTLSIATNDGSDVYYTTDGTDPTTSSTKYTAPITLTGNFTYKAIAAKSGKFNSNVVSKEVNWFKCAEVAYTQELINGQPVVKLSTATPGATIYYHVGYYRDSDDPTENDLYTDSNPIEYNSGDYINAIAVKDDYKNSGWKRLYMTYPETYSLCNTPSIDANSDTRTITITSSEEGVTFYYTLDGTAPSTASTKYTEPFKPTANGEVKAIAAKEGKVNSNVASYSLEDWFRLADVIFEPEYDKDKDEYTIRLTHEVEGVTITYYTTSDNTEKKYEGTPVPVVLSDYIYAKAEKEGIPTSNVARYYISKDNFKVSAPSVSSNREASTLTIKTTTYGATIYYTTDGKDPTSASTKLEDGTLKITRNASYKFIALKDKMTDSDVTSYKIEWFNCSTPSIETDDNLMVTIKTATEGATIYYAYEAEGGLEASDGSLSQFARVYTEPFKREYYGYIYTKAVKDGYTDSGSNYDYSSSGNIRCELKVDNYDGHHLKLATSPGATIYYTTNGNYPYEGIDEESGIMKYNGESIEINSQAMIRAMAYRTYTYSSELLEYTPPFYAGTGGAILQEAGSLAAAMSWEKDPSTITEFKVEGPLNGNDLAFIKSSLTGLQRLDMSNTNLEQGTIPDEAFSGLPIITFVSPSGVTQVGEKIFANCPNLASVVWNSSTKLPNSTFDENVNPNLLLFLLYEASAPSNSTAKNLIVNGKAASITLVDDENCNYDCPQEFYAQEISYTHNFKKTSGNGAGWESIVLPFNVTRVFHENKGNLIPFKTYEEQGNPEALKPFWLREFTLDGFVDATQIEANKPYIICMPNNESYATRFRLGGKVTFYADNAYVPVSEPLSSTRGNVTFTANYIAKPTSGEVLALNTEEYDGHAPGSIFVNEARTIRPFEAYATSKGLTRSYIAVRSLGGDGNDDTTGIVERKLDTCDIIKVYDLSGALIKQGNAEDVTKSLPKGVYIVSGKKFIVK